MVEEKEVWEELRHSSFVKVMGSDSDIGPVPPNATPRTADNNTTRSGTSSASKVISPGRSKSDLKMASKTSLVSLQRSNSTQGEEENSDEGWGR